MYITQNDSSKTARIQIEISMQKKTLMSNATMDMLNHKNQDMENENTWTLAQTQET